jgi:hypothetical protein
MAEYVKFVVVSDCNNVSEFWLCIILMWQYCSSLNVGFSNTRYLFNQSLVMRVYPKVSGLS